MEKSAKIIVNYCMGVKKNEEVLIVVDENSRGIGKAIFKAAKDTGAEIVMMEIIEPSKHGSEPPRLAAEAMKSADVVIAPTSKSLSHTRARKEANEAGTRFASMPTITEKIMSRTMSSDYEKIRSVSNAFRDLLSAGSDARLTTPLGSDVTFVIKGREGIADTGMLHAKGAMGNLPAGEAFIAPVEGKTTGVLFIDASMAGIGIVKDPICMVIKDGYVTDLTGGPEAEKLLEIIDKTGPKSRNIAELGIGTNEMAIVSGNVLEDEKVMGTVHVAIGDNSTIGGNVEVPLHMDGIITKPTLVIDGKTVIKDGKHLI